MWTSKSVACVLGAVVLPAASLADTAVPTTATFTVSAQVVAGCGVAGGGAGSGLNFGTLDFGAHPAIATGDLSAATSGSTLQIECSPGSTLKMSVDGGGQPSAGNTQRNLQGPGGARVAYRLYADAAHTRAIGIGQAVSIPVSGTTSLPIYGALTLPGGAVPAGTYTDVAQVTLSY
ncbi:spore coat U domain-containing protein [Burkholderia pseudomultivorans]|uniref:Csu type fimbrial protein n=1 Tax=Burkholderia pseudomultivorans TaxID=1207504 RepID=UPI00188E8E14|nr:spore coat U domain-containing protein [Burkholderia pseudomultivorans]MBF5014017.1 spore coat protein U domain-containing protein [Burkholderia pseudomultivorans]